MNDSEACVRRYGLSKVGQLCLVLLAMLPLACRHRNESWTSQAPQEQLTPRDSNQDSTPDAQLEPPQERPPSCEEEFSLCTCPIEALRMPSVEAIVKSPGNSQIERERTASDLYRLADHYLARYSKGGSSLDGAQAIRYFSGFLTVVMASYFEFEHPGVPRAPHYIVRLYCDMGCSESSEAVVPFIKSLRYNDPARDETLSFCKNG